MPGASPCRVPRATSLSGTISELLFTLQLQGLAGRELPELAVGQGEFVPLELQRHRGLWLGHSTWRPREGSQLGYFDYLSTCGNAEKKETNF